MGAMKFLKDVATFGIIFWTPTLIRAILDGTSIKPHLPGEQEQGVEEDALQPHGRRRQLQAAGNLLAGAATWVLASVPEGAVRQLLTGEQEAGGDECFRKSLSRPIPFACLPNYPVVTCFRDLSYLK